MTWHTTYHKRTLCACPMCLRISLGAASRIVYLRASKPVFLAWGTKRTVEWSRLLHFWYSSGGINTGRERMNIIESNIWNMNANAITRKMTARKYINVRHRLCVETSIQFAVENSIKINRIRGSDTVRLVPTKCFCLRSIYETRKMVCADTVTFKCNGAAWSGCLAGFKQGREARTISSKRTLQANLCGSIVGKKCDKIKCEIDWPKNKLRDVKGEVEI